MRKDVRAGLGVQSVDMTLKVLLAVAHGPGPRPLKDIAAAARMAPSSAHRHLTSLARAGMVEQHDATGRYDLGSLVLDLGLLALAQRDPVRLIGSSLEDLRDRLNETVFLAVWANRGPTIVRWEEAARAVTVNVRVGSVLPLMRSATGRVFLAWLQPASTAGMLRNERAVPKRVELLRRTMRQRGLGCVEGDLLPGIVLLSAPVFNHQGNGGCNHNLGTSRRFRYRPEWTDRQNAQKSGRGAFRPPRLARKAQGCGGDRRKRARQHFVIRDP
jgi:DNA-binding IclR family transcriptional regulator